MRKLAALILLVTWGASTATAGGLADAKNSFSRWMGYGYSDGYHASKCYRPGGPCSPCDCVPYSPRHPRNPARAVGQAYFNAAHCYECEGCTHEPLDESSSSTTVRDEAVEPKPAESASPKSTP